jgi:hypothetical protein
MLVSAVAGMIVMATASACSTVEGSARPAPAPTASTNPPTTASSITSTSPTTPTTTVDAKEVLSKICSGISAKLVGSLFQTSGVKIKQDPVEQHGEWESASCGITGSGGFTLTAFAEIGPLTVSAQAGLNGITDQSGVTDVRPLTGVGSADAAVSFRQKADTITENVVCVGKRTATGTVIIGVFDADNHGYAPLIQLASQLAT